MSRRPFTRIEENRLVSCIKKFPQIYDCQHKEYKNQELRNAVWSRISVEVGRSVEDCKKRWRSIRDANNRLKRAQRELDKKNSSKWILADQLGFLERKQPGERIRKENETSSAVGRFGSSKNGDGVEDVPKISYDSYEGEGKTRSENALTIPSTCRFPSVKRKSCDSVCAFENKPLEGESVETVFHLREEKCRCEEDPIDFFFKSMALSVRRLPPVLVAEAKSKVCKIVSDLEIRASLSPSDVVSVVTQEQVPEDDDVKDSVNM